MAFRLSYRHPKTMEDLKNRLGESFREARARKGLTQETLAGMVGVTTETISNSERGESLVTVPVLLAMVAALELDLTDLVKDTPIKRPVLSKKRLRLDRELRQLGEKMTEGELELLVGIGRLVRGKRGG